MKSNNLPLLAAITLAGISSTQAAVVARYDASGLSAGAITTWADSSGNGYDATNTGNPMVVAGAQNGLAVVNFDGDDYFTIPDTYTIGTAFSVAKYSSATNPGNFNFYDGLFSGDGSAGAEIYWSGHNGSTDLWSETALDSRYLNGTLSEAGAPGSFNLYSGVDASTQTLTGYNIGADRSSVFGATRAWEGDIAEIILFDTALSDFDRMGVEVYLDEKWGLGQNLSTTYGTGNYNTDLGALGLIPEPGTYALLAGLLSLGSVMVRRRR
jgi:hypothetical protein